MLAALGSLTFLSPFLLLALLVLPIIWWLLRHTPPQPKRTLFPPFRLLLGLNTEHETPQHSPWWLTLLRMVLAACVILAFAEPTLNPKSATQQSEGPTVILVDNGWTSSAEWDLRIQAAREEILAAQELGKPLVLMATAQSLSGQDAELINADEALERLALLKPQPFKTSRELLMQQIQAADLQLENADVVWLSDGIEDGQGANFPNWLKELDADGTIAVYEPSANSNLMGLLPPKHGAGESEATIIRSRLTGVQTGRLQALASDGRILAGADFTFADDSQQAVAQFDLPLELRNEISLLQIVDAENAGAVQLLDDKWRRRRVGLISGETQDSSQPLLSQLYYVEKAIAPFADLVDLKTSNINEAVDLIIENKASMVVLTDVGNLIGETREKLSRWVEEGGTLVRFAGPRLAAAASDELSPVNLRRGGRILGGTLSWSNPQPLGEVNENSPLAGLEVSPEILVNQQVLAEPDSRLGDKTWVQLADGTPLITAENKGKGRIILFHVTANTSWSNLPLSGMFVSMLERIVSSSGVIYSHTASGDKNAEIALRPIKVLDGFGRLSEPGVTDKSFKLAEIDDLRPKQDFPPGFYGNSGFLRTMNVLQADETIKALELQGDEFLKLTYDSEGPQPLKYWLLLIATILLLMDTAILLATRYFLNRAYVRGPAATSAILVVITGMSLAFVTQSAVAQTSSEIQAKEEHILFSSLQTRLAYVITSDQQANEVARAGLTGLTRIIAERTSLEPGLPVGVDIAKDELAFYPLIYWPITANVEIPNADALGRIDAFMKNGGTVLFDTKDQASQIDGVGFQSTAASQILQKILQRLDVPSLQPVPTNHVLTKAFYLLSGFPGRFSDGPLWVEANPLTDSNVASIPTSNSDGVSSILITSNDLAGAWAIDANDNFLLPTIPNTRRQRELSFRVGINLVMYTLTGNYKADQVHLPALLERLGQ